jgi:ABC-type spermidine/putrescine transport system permease subunit I
MGVVPTRKSLFLLPAALLLAVGLVLPACSLFFGGGGANGETGYVLRPSVIWRVQWTTIRIAALVALFSTALAGCVALLVRPLGGRARAAVLFACFFPLGVHLAFRVFALQYLMSSSGPVASALRVVPLLGSLDPSALLFTQSATIIGLIHWTFPTAVMVIYTPASRLRGELLDAAALLGASGRATLVRVIIPLLLPYFLLTFSLTFCLAYGSFITPAALGGLNDITVARLIGTLLSEGQADSARLPAAVGLATPLLVFGVLYLCSAWIRGRNKGYEG